MSSVEPQHSTNDSVALARALSVVIPLGLLFGFAAVPVAVLSGVLR